MTKNHFKKFRALLPLNFSSNIKNLYTFFKLTLALFEYCIKIYRLLSFNDFIDHTKMHPKKCPFKIKSNYFNFDTIITSVKFSFNAKFWLFDRLYLLEITEIMNKTRNSRIKMLNSFCYWSNLVMNWRSLIIISLLIET